MGQSLNDEEDKLLPVIPPEALEAMPTRKLIEHLYWQVIQTQVIVLKVKGETARIKQLEDALSQITFLRSGFFKLRYNHERRKLTISPNFDIDFKEGSQEALLLSQMFHKKSGKPKKLTWQCSEMTATLRKKGYDLKTDNSVYKALLRINERIKKETRIEGLIDVSRKQFFIVNTF
jgi:hypothetical protein